MPIDLTETSTLDKKLQLEHSPITKKIDKFVTNVGEIFNWFWVILVAVILTNVILRYVKMNLLETLKERI